MLQSTTTEEAGYQVLLKILDISLSIGFGGGVAESYGGMGLGCTRRAHIFFFPSPHSAGAQGDFLRSSSESLAFSSEEVFFVLSNLSAM